MHQRLVPVSLLSVIDSKKQDVKVGDMISKFWDDMKVDGCG